MVYVALTAAAGMGSGGRENPSDVLQEGLAAQRQLRSEISRPHGGSIVPRLHDEPINWGGSR